ncbi:hypothetical protein M8542_36100 [Amycolatopsis sp. OK19-0408]|uniref:Uncharacterized protein n=1 Tax=Amycolatopsis iheyensis TaxID=2945988 RepID=A0A9X2NL24_9PSEU|nr:hypothetical protein [Amycolatopsis iheyensis]MCR6488267.1 hypothetical protein [Amycolatopsis iheyensis]
MAYDIDPRRKPRIAGFLLCESERALLTGMTTTGFRLATAYRVGSWSTAFLFERVAADVARAPGQTGIHTEHDDARAAPAASTGRSLHLVR